MFKKALWNGLACLFAFLLIFSIALGIVLEANRGAVDGFFGTISQDAKFIPDETQDDGEQEEDNTSGGDEDELKTIAEYNAFVPDAKYLVKDDNGTITGGNAKQLVLDAIDIGRRHETEGAVLLKNKDNALPLKKGADTKVTLLGIRAYNTIINSNQGQASKGSIVSLRTALGGTKTDFANEYVSNKLTSEADFDFSELKLNGDGVAAGAGFTVNPNYTADYSGFGVSNLKPGNNYSVGEKNPSTLSDDFKNSFASYNDAAIVVFSRASSESNDYAKGSLKADEKDAAAGITEPLQLTPNERAVLSLAKEKFKKVIVLLNTNSAIEIGDLKNDDGVDAILWIGHPGNYGTLGIADILCGNVSPSGGLYDVYATSNLSTPAMQNMGTYSFAGLPTGQGNTIRSTSKNYLAEFESIYVGYRYYETRYYDVVYGQGNASEVKEGTHQVSTGTWKYADEVAYGFGYGKSYTDFEYTLRDVTVEKKGDHEMYATVTVSVQNVGKVAGRTPVQIYGQAPYTSYDKQHLVEKSAIQLLAFEKTGILEPTETQQFTVKVDMQNFASYDMTYEHANKKQGSYILEGGDYYFAIGNGAHDALNNVLALQGKTTANGMDYDGEKAAAKVWNYNYNGVDGTTFGYSKTGKQIQNQIPYIDWNYFFETKQFSHLSRQDWKGTYPEESIQLTVNDVLIEYLSGEIIVGESERGTYYEIATDDDVSKITWNSTPTHKWFDMGFAEWDDARWDQLLNQLDLEEATAFAGKAGPPYNGLDGVNFLSDSALTDNAGNGIVFALNGGKDKNMPWVIKDGPYAAWNGQVFGSAPLVASSFDKELMYDIGDFVGTEALFMGLPIVWGPGLNTHRSAYNGRNGEYYSEDPVLSGYCALNFAVAARKRGLIAAAKHYVFNDQENGRKGVAPFMTEQRAREIELRAFQVAIEAVDFDGYGMIGLMTSFSKVGPVEVTNSWGMMTGILQQEWGFTGYAVTDIADDLDLYTGMVYAGCTGFDLRMSSYNGVAGFNSWKSGAPATTKVTPKITQNATMFAGDATMQNIIRTSIKRTLWVFSQSNLINRYNTTVVVGNIPDPDRPLAAGQKGHYEPVEIQTSWRILYKTLIGITAVLLAAAVALFVVSTVLKKENN